jgi:hypothetical protein
MSKKVLNYAGRQPMLLALIMATIVLGLLFSGWLTPSPMRAQGTGGGNPGSGNENTNCPSYTTNVSISCPSITSTPQITTPSFCVNEGDSVPDPSYAPAPAASSGNIVTTITETCSNTVTSSTNTITYSFGAMYCTPAKPSGKVPRTYSSEYFIPVSSSNTNCPSPGPLDIGSVTWHVIDTTPKINIWSASCWVSYVPGQGNEITSALGLSAGTYNKANVIGSIIGKWTPTCCYSTNGPYDKTSVSGSINGNVSWTNSLTVTIPLYNGILGNWLASVNMIQNGAANGTLSPSLVPVGACQTAPIIVQITVSYSGGGSPVSVTNTYDGYGYSITASLRAAGNVSTSGPDGNGNCNYNGSAGPLTVSGGGSIVIKGKSYPLTFNFPWKPEFPLSGTCPCLYMSEPS